MTDRHPVTGRWLAYDCETDCQEHCAGPCDPPPPSWRQVGLLVNDTEFIPQAAVAYPFAEPPGQTVQAVYVRADL